VTASRVTPQALDAEQAVLGGVFLKNTLFNSLVDMVGPEDFYSPVHATIWRAFLALDAASRPIDLVTVADHLRQAGDLDRGTVDLLLSRQQLVADIRLQAQDEARQRFAAFAAA
jgi:replicative DNA helicase